MSAYRLPGVRILPNNQNFAQPDDIALRSFRFIGGDLVYNPSGKFDKISNPLEKVGRDVQKLLSTDIEFGGNETLIYRYNPDYGQALNNKKLYEGLSRQEIIDLVSAIVDAALRYYVTIQQSQDNLPPDEVVEYFDFIVFYDSQKQDLVRCPIKVKLVTAPESELGVFTQEV